MRFFVLGLVLTVAGSADAARRARDFVQDPRAAYPHATIVGDVRVERGVEIGRGAVIVGGAKPVYLIGRTKIGAESRITQTGQRPLVVLHSTVENPPQHGAAKIEGHGVIAASDTPGITNLAGGRVVRTRVTGIAGELSGPIVDSHIGGVVGGDVSARGATIMGVAKGALKLDGTTVEGIAQGPASGSRLELGRETIPFMSFRASPGVTTSSATLGVANGIMVGNAFQGIDGRGQRYNYGSVVFAP